MNWLVRILAFNSSRFRLWQENAAFAATVPSGALVLDAGAGNAPYEPLFRHARYESADLFGFRHLFGEAGFRVDRLDWMEGYFGTVGYQLQGMARHLPWKPGQLGQGLWGWLLIPFLVLWKAVCAAASIAFHRLETRIKVQGQGYPKNYVVVASKL